MTDPPPPSEPSYQHPRANDAQIIAAARRLQKTRSRPEYQTITAEEAKRQNMRPMTSPYCIRQFAQCDMLDQVIADLSEASIEHGLVMNSAGNRITVWRRYMS